MAATVSFKVYMSTEEESTKEVRRFGVEVDVVTNFVYLREKLQTIFPKLRGKHFTVSWKDSDGDDVVISSDEELQIALQETSSSEVRKLYVRLHSEYPSGKAPSAQPTTVPGPIHYGVTCDGCDEQIQGFRYKCVQCPDYDLCVECESRGEHPEHCMIRLSDPLQWKPHYGRRLATQVNRFVRKAQSQASKEEDNQRQCPFKSAGKHHGKSSRQANRAPSWIDTFATYLDEWANLPGECPMKETAKEAKEGDPPATPSAEAKKPQEEAEKSPSEQIRLLTNVGLAVGENFLSQFLDPLVNMQAKNAKPAASTSGTPSTSSAAPSPNNEENKESPNETIPTPKFPGEGKKLGENLIDAAAPPPAAPTPSTEKTSFENEGWTLLNKSDSPAPIVTSPGSPSTGAVPKQVHPSAPTESHPKSIYPTLPEAPQRKVEDVPIIYHANPTIQKAVESMIQMGFSNEGGWLTNLLVSKGGDIAAALDALSPVRR